MAVFGRSEVTLCGAQDAKIQWLTNYVRIKTDGNMSQGHSSMTRVRIQHLCSAHVDCLYTISGLGKTSYPYSNRSLDKSENFADRRFRVALRAPPLSSQASDLTTVWYWVDWWNARWSDHRVVLCWLVECTMSWVCLQHSNDCNLPHIWLLSSMNVHRCTCFEGFLRPVNQSLDPLRRCNS